MDNKQGLPTTRATPGQSQVPNLLNMLELVAHHAQKSHSAEIQAKIMSPMSFKWCCVMSLPCSVEHTMSLVALLQGTCQDDVPYKGCSSTVSPARASTESPARAVTILRITSPARPVPVLCPLQCLCQCYVPCRACPESPLAKPVSATCPLRG